MRATHFCSKNAFLYRNAFLLQKWVARLGLRKLHYRRVIHDTVMTRSVSLGDDVDVAELELRRFNVINDSNADVATSERSAAADELRTGQSEFVGHRGTLRVVVESTLHACIRSFITDTHH